MILVLSFTNGWNAYPFIKLYGAPKPGSGDNNKQSPLKVKYEAYF